jgi:hypothetical protein
MKIRISMLLALALLPCCVFAADDMQSLRDRFRARHAQLEKLKADGIIGETYKGYVDLVSDDRDNAADLVKAENADRDTLYKALADKEKTTPELVAQRNAKRNFERAEAGEYLQESDGKWRKKT